MINKKNIAVSAMMLSLASNNTNACTCYAVPEELKILEYILKDAKQLAGLTDKSKLVEFLKEKNNYRNKIKGKNIKNLSVPKNTNTFNFVAMFFVYVKKKGCKQQVIAAKELPSDVSSKYIQVTIIFNSGSIMKQINLEDLKNDTEYTISKIEPNANKWGA